MGELTGHSRHLCWNSSLHSFVDGGGKAVSHGLNTVEYKLLGGVTKIVSEYDQEIPQSQTTDKPVAS